MSANITNTPNSGDYNQSYAYGITGNITSKSDVGAYTYADAHPHAATSAGTKNYTYDANGSLTGDGTWTHTYDSRNRLVSSTDGTDTITYTYDEARQRVTKELNGTKTTYVNNYYELEDDGTTVKERTFVYAGGLKVATVTDDGTDSEIVFHHSDHLSGASVDTDGAGVDIQVLDYTPYGSVRLDEKSGDHDNQYKFTGQELDEETGLYYYDARYYDAELGRFVGVDPWGGDIGDPQSLNKYSYVRNNPLRYVDPTGQYFETAIDLVSLGLSMRDFVTNPGIGTSFWLGLDAAATALPVPAVAGYVRHSLQAERIAKYFTEVSARTGKSATQIGTTFLKNITFKANRRAWSAGRAGDSLGSLTGHFELHGKEVGAKSLKDYYNKANDLIENSGTYKFNGRNGDFEYFNPDNNLLTVTDKNDNIRTFHKPKDGKLENLQKRVEKQKKEN